MIKKFCYWFTVIRPRIRRYFWTGGDITCFYFRLTSRPQDVGLRPDEGDVGPINGHSEKRWVMKIPQTMWFLWSSTWSPMYFPKESLSMQNSARQFTFLLHIWLYFHFSFILDPTTCQTWNFIFLGQMIFCEKSESLRWYVRFLIHNRLYSQDSKRLKPFLVLFAKDSTQVPF